MSNENLNYYKEVAVKEFVLESFRSMFFYFEIFNLRINKQSLQKYSSIIIASVTDLINDTNVCDICDMEDYLRKNFFKRLEKFNDEDEVNNLRGIEKINENNHIITFCIWCVDSFYYFLISNLESYKILREYANIIDDVISNQNSSDTAVDLSAIFYNQIMEK